MSTQYSVIYEFFLAAIQDYKIDHLFSESIEDAEAFMQKLLVRGLVGFDDCQKNLEDRDDTTQIFTDDLTTAENVILADLMIVEWLSREVNNVLDMKNHLQDHDFKQYSQAQNLREKSAHLIATRENVAKRITKYGYDNLDWSDL